MSCKVLLTEIAEEDMQLIRDYFLANQQENRIERFYTQMKKVFQRIVLAAECSAPLEKMHRHIAELCDREARESIHEWHCRRRELAEEDQTQCDVPLVAQ